MKKLFFLRIEKYRGKELRDKVSIGSLNEKAENLYSRLCEVVHARRSATAEEARAMFRRTLSLIEELYGSHGGETCCSLVHAEA
jgi:hypothetical protein